MKARTYQFEILLIQVLFVSFAFCGCGSQKNEESQIIQKLQNEITAYKEMMDTECGIVFKNSSKYQVNIIVTYSFDNYSAIETVRFSKADTVFHTFLKKCSDCRPKKVEVFVDNAYAARTQVKVGDLNREIEVSDNSSGQPMREKVFFTLHDRPNFLCMPPIPDEDSQQKLAPRAIYTLEMN